MPIANKITQNELQQIINDIVKEAKTIVNIETPDNARLDPLNRVMHDLWLRIPTSMPIHMSYQPVDNDDQLLYRKQISAALTHKIRLTLLAGLDENEIMHIIFNFIDRVQKELRTS